MDVFKADIGMLVGRQITITGFKKEVVDSKNGELEGVVVSGIADGVNFEFMTFSSVITEHLEKMPSAWFPFNTTIIKKTSNAGFDYYAFGK